MRFQHIALLALAFPTFALAAAPVPKEQCAAITAKALQEGRYKDVVDLFSTPGKATNDRKNETLAALTDTFARLGPLSDMKAISKRPDGNTIKMEITDGMANFPIGKFSLVTHSMRAAVGGLMYLDIAYHMGQPDCALIAVAVQIPRTEVGNSTMEFTFETDDEAALNQFVALLAKNKIHNFSIAKTSVDGKVTSWKLTTPPFASSDDVKAAMTFTEPFQKLKGTTTFTYGISNSNAVPVKASAH